MNLINFGKASQLLVCETDGFSLTAAVLQRTGQDLKVLHSARSSYTDMPTALNDLVTQLRAAGWQGKQAVLITPAVCNVLVELPVDPKKPRPMNQMQELIRWEVEPLLMQHQSQWSLGHILQTQGYMTAEQVMHLTEAQQDQRTAGSESLNYQRFGDLAVKAGYLHRDQLSVCIEQQQWLKGDDEQIDCGWSGQAEVADAPGMFHWLVSAVSHQLASRWQQAFARNGLQLKALLPLTGCAAALMPIDETPRLLMEVHRHRVFACRMQQGHVSSQRVQLHENRRMVDSCLEAWHAVNGKSEEPLSVASWQTSAETLLNELKQLLALDKPIESLPARALHADLSPAMQGAGRRMLGLSGKQSIVEVQPGGPAAPLLQRLEVRAALVASLVLVLIAGMEISLGWRQHTANVAKSAIDDRAKTLDDAIARINAANEQIEARKKLLEEQHANEQRMQARIDFFNREVIDRRMLLQALLGILQNTVDDDVLIERLDEYGKSVPFMPVRTPGDDERPEVESFNLDAWALTEAAAQEFIHALTLAVQPWDLQVRDVQLSEKPGPLRLNGFAVSMRLVRYQAPAAAEPAAEEEA